MRSKSDWRDDVSIFPSIPFGPSITRDKSITARIPRAAGRRILCHELIGRRKPSGYAAFPACGALRAVHQPLNTGRLHYAQWKTRFNQTSVNSPSCVTRDVLQVRLGFEQARNFVFGSPSRNVISAMHRRSGSDMSDYIIMFIRRSYTDMLIEMSYGSRCEETSFTLRCIRRKMLVASKEELIMLLNFFNNSVAVRRLRRL